MKGQKRFILLMLTRLGILLKLFSVGEGADAIEEHREEGYMLTSSGMSLFTGGTVMGAWIEPVDTNATRVTVVTKRRVSINIATTLRETTFHERFAQAVDIIKAGESLPLEPPD